MSVGCPGPGVPSNEGVCQSGGRGRFTLALRRCCACNRKMGIRVWPWSGRWFVETHSLCSHCEHILSLEPPEERAA